MYDLTVQLRVQHKNCPLAKVDAHGQDGTVDVSVVFDGELEIEDDDPYISDQIQVHKEMQAAYDQEPWMSEMSDFVQAKRKG